uniref:Uncharacterized protein n=1 Tax=Arundo donax TaxID=35708 RepID=A0A0A8YUA0_ARUDO
MLPFNNKKPSQEDDAPLPPPQSQALRSPWIHPPCAARPPAAMLLAVDARCDPPRTAQPPRATCCAQSPRATERSPPAPRAARQPCGRSLTRKPSASCWPREQPGHPLARTITASYRTKLLDDMRWRERREDKGERGGLKR